MDKTGSTSTLAPKTAHRLFFQWAVKWFYANISENTSTKPDIPSIICLLQAVGFKLREFEKGDQLIPNADLLKNENIRITMECGTSKMVAILEMDNVKCECPDTTEAKDCSFWSISGTGPMGSIDNINKIEETGSNLLPDMPKETTAVVRDVVYRLFKIINNKCDINQNTDSDINLNALCANSTITKSTAELKEGLIRSYTDYYDQNYKPRTTIKFTSNLSNSKFNSTRSIKDSVVNSEKPKLNRQGTYDAEENESMDEPRPSPPKIASSPVLHQLCTSLGQISLQSDEELLGLADYVVKAHQILEKAVNFIIKKIPINSSHSSIPEESHFVKPAPPPLMSSSFCVGSPRSSGSGSLINRSMSSGSSSRPGSACSMPGRTSSLQPTQLNGVQKPLARRSCNATTRASGALPPMRDRASSLGMAQQRSSFQPPAPQTVGLSSVGINRRRSATATASRTTPTTSKLPASKAGQSKSSNVSLSVDRTVLMAKRRISPGPKGQASPATQQQPQQQQHRAANVSLIKAPSRLSSGSTAANVSSKFGYSAVKK